jgi:uncharacterized membrane protein
MATSKARSRNRPAAAKSDSGRPSGGAGSRQGGQQRSQPQRAQSRSQERREGLRQQRRQQRAAAAQPEAAEPSGSRAPKWVWAATLVLALIGLGVSSYLTYAHYTESALMGCSEKAGLVNCGAVTTSSQSMIFGTIPVALTGLIYYVFVVAVMSPWAWMSTWKWMPSLRLVTMVAGMGMVLYLIYAELFQIGAICLYCTSVHIITFLLFSLIVVTFALWGSSENA